LIDLVDILKKHKKNQPDHKLFYFGQVTKKKLDVVCELVSVGKPLD
jgi:hypothetical protein